MPTLRETLEHVWREWGCVCPGNVARYVFNNDGQICFMKGKRFPTPRAKRLGYVRPYLNSTGIEYNHQLMNRRNFNRNREGESNPLPTSGE